MGFNKCSRFSNRLRERTEYTLREWKEFNDVHRPQKNYYQLDSPSLNIFIYKYFLCVILAGSYLNISTYICSTTRLFSSSFFICVSSSRRYNMFVLRDNQLFIKEILLLCAMFTFSSY
jgi:hypothetical protein